MVNMSFLAFWISRRLLFLALVYVAYFREEHLRLIQSDQTPQHAELGGLLGWFVFVCWTSKTYHLVRLYSRALATL
jgi:hypothetical protein